MKDLFMSEEETRRFKSYMVGAGYTITSLAKKLNMTRESLSARVNGRTDFERSEMVIISKLFNVAPSEIFFDLKVA